MIDALQDLLDIMLQLRLAAWIIAHHLDGVVGAHGRTANLQFRAGGRGAVCLVAAGQQQNASQRGDSNSCFTGVSSKRIGAPTPSGRPNESMNALGIIPGMAGQESQNTTSGCSVKQCRRTNRGCAHSSRWLSRFSRSACSLHPLLADIRALGNHTPSRCRYGTSAPPQEPPRWICGAVCNPEPFPEKPVKR